MNQITLTEPEVKSIQSLLSEVASQYSSSENPNFLNNAATISHQLPIRIREFLSMYKLFEPPPGICIISGYPINDKKIGKTPDHWKFREGISPALEEELLLVLYGSLLGDIFGWSTQQNGHIMHDVFPIKGHENEQLGTGSEQLLTWHSEDAFHPFRGDYLGLFCLRNVDRIATTFASIDMVKLGEEHLKVLFEPRFTIRPDESHLEKNRPDWNKNEAHVSLKSAYERINSLNTNPSKVSVLFGSPEAPYMCLDPYFMDPVDDTEARRALNVLVEAIDAVITDIILLPGDCCFIDNYRAVHGRRSFRARYDGTDRWLKRINITRDLRKSRSDRSTCISRILY